MNAGRPGIDLPDLRVVALVNVALHEEADERRTELLRQRLAVEQMVKNPPVVAEAGDGYVVLDGANRTSALRSMGVPDILVQVVDYDQVELGTWFHLVAGVDPDGLMDALREVSGAEIDSSDLAAARDSLAARESLGYFVQPQGQVFLIGGGEGPVRGVGLLKRVVATYKGRADIYRVQSDQIADLIPFYSEVAGLVVFPRFKPEDILAFARQDIKLPTGITRHVIPRRALRLNTDLSLLWSDTPLREKNRWLKEWTRHKLQSGAIRYYEESTFLYDE